MLEDSITFYDAIERVVKVAAFAVSLALHSRDHRTAGKR